MNRETNNSTSVQGSPTKQHKRKSYWYLATQVVLKTKKAKPGRKKKALLLKFSRADHLSNFWQRGQEGEESHKHADIRADRHIS